MWSQVEFVRHQSGWSYQKGCSPIFYSNFITVWKGATTELGGPTIEFEEITSEEYYFEVSSGT